MSTDLFSPAEEAPQPRFALTSVDISIRLRVDGNDPQAMHDAIAQALLLLRLSHFGDRPLTRPTEAERMEINNGGAQLAARITVRR